MKAENIKLDICISG